MEVGGGLRWQWAEVTGGNGPPAGRCAQRRVAECTVWRVGEGAQLSERFCSTGTVLLMATLAGLTSGLGGDSRLLCTDVWVSWVGSCLRPHLLLLASRLNTSTHWCTRPSISSRARGESWRPRTLCVAGGALAASEPRKPPCVGSPPGGPGSSRCRKTGPAGTPAPGPPSRWRMR